MGKKAIVVRVVLVAALIALFFMFQKDMTDTDNVPDDNSLVQRSISGDPFLTSDVNTESTSTTYPTRALSQESAFTTLYREDDDIPVRTNQWFSSAYFLPASESMFVFPLAVRFTEKGVSVSQPRIRAQENIVFGAYDPDMDILFDEPVHTSISESSDFSTIFSITSTRNAKQIARMTITRGSPYIFIDLEKGVRMHVSARGVDIEQLEKWAQINKTDGVEYGIFNSASVETTREQDTPDTMELTALSNDGLVTVALRPGNVEWSTIEKYANNPIETTEASFLNDTDNYVNVYSLSTRNGGDTLWGMLPHQTEDSLENDCAAGTTMTLRGTQTFCEGSIFYVYSDREVPSSSLDVNSLTADQRTKLTTLVRDDIAAFTGFSATDTYFLGKELLRAAHLYDFAVQLDMSEESTKMKEALYHEFNTWRANTEGRKAPESGKYITYDDDIRGIVGHKTSFGSEEFNDHHFHYGYFVHTAAILGRHDNAFVDENAQIVNLFLNDYANADRENETFPFVRAFDFYEGHSWAAGTSRFGDGNNQESSSEAVHAYYAAYLWTALIGADAQREASLWLYNQEAYSAGFYWLLTNPASPRHEGYTSSIVSLLWGGKIEWGTWFSGEPEAKLGIELIPFTAASQYLQYTPAQIENHLAQTSFPEQKLFFDQLLMYKALADPDEALALLENVTDENLDGGNTLSFMYAWIALQKNKRAAIIAQ